MLCLYGIGTFLSYSVILESFNSSGSNKYKSSIVSIDLMSDSDDNETPSVIQEKFDEKLKLLDIDIALLDYSPYVIKGNVEKFYKPYRKWRCCKK